MIRKIKHENIKILRPNVYVIKVPENNVEYKESIMTDFELTFDTIKENRKTVKEAITASNQVNGDIVTPDDFQGYQKINTPKQPIEGDWDFEE